MNQGLSKFVFWLVENYKLWLISSELELVLAFSVLTKKSNDDLLEWVDQNIHNIISNQLNGKFT